MRFCVGAGGATGRHWVDGGQWAQLMCGMGEGRAWGAKGCGGGGGRAIRLRFPVINLGFKWK